ncbi:hypothetical protein [Streptomyces sp. 11x1]|uniref:hypothetical protein n=1 Tax=Streptomyces sp. 11x1 TaxID=3038642 RepID=UPI002930E047|nr:hypothetical protein [Streptomyces sp. 11x1]WNZ14981.1 hypothetical protein P8T65_46945 [Streptomyces sp. 11x1]
MTLSQPGPALVQIAPAYTPPDADPDAWVALGTVDDLQIALVVDEPDFELPTLPMSKTVNIDLSPHWDDVVAQLRVLRFPPHPACGSARKRIEERLRRRRITIMLQAALHSYRFPVPPVSGLSLASLANPA